ncbi:hypothetical protein WDU94_004407 [Cyamophila willieti]
MICLCLYEITSSLGLLSKLSLCRFISLFVGMLLQGFLASECSELADSCQAMLRQSLSQCNWQLLSPVSQRDLTVVLAQLQRPNHIRFCNGLFVVNRVTFSATIQRAYTFVNFMQLKSIKNG